MRNAGERGDLAEPIVERARRSMAALHGSLGSSESGLRRPSLSLAKRSVSGYSSSVGTGRSSGAGEDPARVWSRFHFLRGVEQTGDLEAQIRGLIRQRIRSEEDQRFLCIKIFEGKKTREISAHLGLPFGTVASKIPRAQQTAPIC